MRNDATDVIRVVLIRHGQSASNAGGWLSGQDTCGGLTELGVTQAEALRDRLAADPSLAPDRVVVSTMRRARETADIASAPTGIEPEAFADLIERTSGEAEGLTIAEYTERYGAAPWTDWEAPLSPGGESGPEFVERISNALDRVVAEGRSELARHEPQEPGQMHTVWVVCHAGLIMATALGRWVARTGPIDLKNLAVMSPQNSSISEWVVDATDTWRLARFNDATHLVGISDTPAPGAS